MRSEDFAHLKGEKLARALEIARKLKGRETLDAFIRRMTPHRPPPAHIQPLLELLQEARWHPIRAVIEMPPRHAKTTTMLNAIPWWLSEFPTDTCGYYTYSDRKAWSESRKARDLAIASGIDLSEDAASVAEWRTEKGGGLLAGGAGGGLTGYGISGLMIVDDPYKNREEADSKIIRDKIEDWFNEVAFTRDEGCSFLVMHTRWHEKDLAGKLIAQGWREVRLPAIAEQNDILGREPGSPLWADRFPLKRLNAIEKQIGPYSWASLYQQRPRPRGSKLFGPEHYYDPKTVDLTGCRMSIGADTASSKKTAANASSAISIAIKGRGEEKIGYILDRYHNQVTVPQYARDLRGFQERNHGIMANVEVNGIGAGTYQIIKDVDDDARISPVRVIGDKFGRFQGISAAWNQARLLVPLGAEWVPDYVSRMQEVTGINDDDDDDADATSLAWEGDMGPADYESWGGVLPRRY